ncbi:hypothetical protein M427DRAFT_58159 [Gonapodya prolifera JEL478]|uniref:Seipin n=1 Tax=Gonapodya prolifera (strain JEL478) TaxID=1344416 RepID=A0A139AB58_GONPJ|nr:hypothetical protein M427DRAFT_58159 [Gonapodya prolifera JEL478]|eukprot:KXS13904.1 hypothetical protein M427DRAFT_58159 [Gonapodya prolifera JEL478]
MQYGSVSPHAPSAFMVPTNPHAIIPLLDDKYRFPFLLPHQQYHIAVQLRVPDSDHNERLGNFMCEAELKRELVGKNGIREPGEVIARESRPGILPYRSPALRLASALARAGPVMIFDAFREERDIQIVLWEEWASGRADALPTNLHLTVSHPLGSPSSHLHTISTHLLVSLRFQGLRNYMHNWPLLTALVVTAVFATWNAAIVAAVWWGIKGGVSMEEGGEKEQFDAIPPPPRGKHRIEEDEESEDEAEPVGGARSKGKGPARVPQDEDDEEEDEFDSPEDDIVPSAIPAIAVVHRDTVPEVAIKAEVEIKQEAGLEGEGQPEDESNGSYDVIGRDEGQPDVGEGGVRRRVTAALPK